ncbi:MAG: Crp/Fnr family transcriptional regulator [Fidelibacterota bacterium]
MKITGMRTIECCDFIEKNPTLNRYCSHELKQTLEANKICHIYKKGQIIFFENQPVNGIYIINEGKVKLWKKGIYTHEQIIRFASDGDLMGYRACIDETNYALSATALDNVSICYIDKNTFFHTLKRNPVLHLELLKHYANNLRNIENRLRDMAEMNVREKVADALLIAINSFGLEQDGKTINVTLLRSDIASIAGTSTDQVIKTLSQFKKEGIISTSGKKIIIENSPALEDIVSKFLPD